MLWTPLVRLPRTVPGRGAKHVESVPDVILDDVMARVAAILKIE